MDFVFVHGGDMSTKTWNMLSGQKIHTDNGRMGGKIWDGTIAMLRSMGHKGYKLTLLDELTSNLSDHISQVTNLILDHKLENIILVGHSYGGFVITGVAERIPEKIHLIVYLDAALPDPGESLIDVLNKAYPDKSDHEQLIPDPNPPYIEKLYYNPENFRKFNKVYIRCMKSDFKEVTNMVKQKIDKNSSGWKYYEIQSSHVPMADFPEEFNKLIQLISEF